VPRPGCISKQDLAMKAFLVSMWLTNAAALQKPSLCILLVPTMGSNLLIYPSSPRDMTRDSDSLLVAALKSAVGLSKPHIRPPHHVLYAALELGRSLRVLGMLQRHLGDGTDATAQLERALQVTQSRAVSARYFVATRSVLLSSSLAASCCAYDNGWSAHRALF